MLRSLLFFGFLVCFLTGCQQKPDSRLETGRSPEIAENPAEPDSVEVSTMDPPQTGDSVRDAPNGRKPEHSRTRINGDVEAEDTLDRLSEIRLAKDRFRELDKTVALLEVTVFGENLGRPFEDAISRLYDLRNEVALSLAEAETAPPGELESHKDQLLEAIDELDRRVRLTAQAVDSADGNPHQDLADRIWL